MLSALLAVLIVVLGIIIWSIKQHREPDLHVVSDAPLQDQLRSLAGLTHSTVVEGNSVEIFENGAFFDALLRDMKTARRSLHFETYLWEEGELSRRMSAALAERARAGVTVRVLLDNSGCNMMGEAAPNEMRAAGCKLRMFHARRLSKIGLQNERDHRKLVVIDGQTAFLGGHCVKDRWLGDARDETEFKDLSVRLRGPVVHALQSTFGENWVEESGELFTGDDVFPSLEPAGDTTVHVARVRPLGSASAVKLLHYLAICLAKKHIYIQNPYFLPSLAAVEALGRAVDRGVDVRVMVPAAQVSDLPLVQHAAHRNFGKLLACGVRILEYRRSLLHQKTMTIDGVWSAIGSSNFDDRSLEINDEITAGFLDPALAARLEEIFHRDAAHCVELNRESWSARGVGHRLRDHACYLLRYQL
jgi:cardiolipin synthase